MKAWVFYEPGKHQFEAVADPAPAADQVMVQVKACGICGSDVAYHYGMSSLETPNGKGPLILGHEYTGQVVAVGESAARLFGVGDRVVLDPVQYCNACAVCKRGQPNLCENKTVLGVSTNGGFAELSVSHYTGVHKLPENVDYVTGALTEPLACATYALQKAEVHPGMSVAVFGMGPIGLMMQQLARAAGAAKVFAIGVNDYRLEAAQALGADLVLNTRESTSPFYCVDVKAAIADATGGAMADRALVATGAVPAMESALEITGRRSVIVYFGLPGDDARVALPALQSILWDKTIRFSWLAPNTWPAALDALAGGLIDTKPLVSKTIPLEDTVKGIEAARTREGNPMKIVVTPS